MVEGELLVTRSASPLHQPAVVKLVVRLNAYLEVESVGYVLTSRSDVELEPEFVTQPDVYVLPITEWRRILRDGNNVVRERPLYQRHLPNYLIVDLDARVFERWTSDQERPEISSNSLVWHPTGAATPFTLDIPAYFHRVLDT